MKTSTENSAIEKIDDIGKNKKSCILLNIHNHKGIIKMAERRLILIDFVCIKIKYNKINAGNNIRKFKANTLQISNIKQYPNVKPKNI